jgi:DNA replication protein DnaC
LIEDRHGLRSTLITSQLPIGAWHEYLNDPTVADALLDRLLNGAHRLELKGESMRKKSANLTKSETKK